MIRYFVPLAAVIALASTAHAQSVASQEAARISRELYQKQEDIKARAQGEVQESLTPTGQTYINTPNASASFGTSTTTSTTTTAGFGGVNVVTNQLGYAGYGNYPPAYGYAGYPAPTYPAYGYPVPTYGYPAYPAPAYGYPAPPPYGYPPQAYYIPGQTTILGTPPQHEWATPTTITSFPQVITTPGYPPYNYCPPGGYGYSSRTTVTRGNVNINRGGLNVSIGGTSIRRNRR